MVFIENKRQKIGENEDENNVNINQKLEISDEVKIDSQSANDKIDDSTAKVNTKTEEDIKVQSYSEEAST